MKMVRKKKVRYVRMKMRDIQVGMDGVRERKVNYWKRIKRKKMKQKVEKVKKKRDER